MTYDIFSTTAPTMPNTGRGTHFIKFMVHLENGVIKSV